MQFNAQKCIYDQGSTQDPVVRVYNALPDASPKFRNGRKREEDGEKRTDRKDKKA